MSMSTFHAIYASAVFVIAYALITTERFNKTMVALAGAVAVFFLPVVNSHEVFYSEDTGIDWDVIFLLLGMMIIVSVVRQTGVFEYIAIWSAKRAKGSPLRIMILLVLVTAVGSAFLDNVTTVLLIAPVTLLVCDRLAVSAVPFLIVEAFAANIGGAATLVGDPTTHHHRHRSPPEFHFVPGQHGAGGDHRARRPAGADARACFPALSPSIPSGSPMSCRWTRAKRSVIASC